MKTREVSLAFLIIGLLLGGIAGSTLSPQRAAETVTKFITTTSEYTVTMYSTITKPVYSTITEERTVTTTLYLTETKTATLTMETTTTITNTETIIFTSTATVTAAKPPPITRYFDIHLIKDDVWVRVQVEIPSELVESYSGRRIPVYVGEEEETFNRIVSEAIKQAPIFNLAMSLWELANNDLELYGAYALQVIHQMTYNFSKAYGEEYGVQPPLTTLIENSGICVDYALLYAALLKAVNASTVLVGVKVWNYESGVTNAPHMMVGVKLPNPPSLPQQYHNYFLNKGYPGDYSITINSKTYYLADATPPSYVFIEEPEGKMLPPENYYPAFIGEHLWDKIEIVKVYHLQNK